VLILRNRAITKLLEFVKKQPKPFKVNMLRASAQTFLSNLTSQFQAIFILRLGATPVQLGITNSIGGAAATLIALPTGWLADRGGIKRILVWGAPFMVLSSLIFGLAFDWTVTILAMLLLLLGTQLFNVACPMVCGSYLKNEERATGKQLCDTVSSIPALFAPMIAATLIAVFGGLSVEGIRPVFLLQALGFLILFLYTRRFYFDTQNRCRSRSASSFSENTKAVFSKGRAVKRWMFFSFLSSSTLFLSQTFLPAFVTDVKFGDEFTVGGMTTASMAFPIVLSLLLGRAADTYGRKKVLYITIPLYCLSVLLLIYAHNTLILMISGILQGFYLLSAVTQGAVTADLVPVQFIGTWYGLLSICRGVAIVVAPLVGGVIWSTIGPQYVFFLIILIQISELAILWLLVPETLQKGSIDHQWDKRFFDQSDK
jgi:MFS family permease